MEQLQGEKKEPLQGTTNHLCVPFGSAVGKRTIYCSEGLGIAGPGAGSCLTWAIVAQWYTEFWCTVRRCCSSLSGPTTQPTCSQERRRRMVNLWVPAQAPLSVPVLVSLYFLDRTSMKQLWYFHTLRLKAERGCSVPSAVLWQRDRDGDRDTMRCHMGYSPSIQWH